MIFPLHHSHGIQAQNAGLGQTPNRLLGELVDHRRSMVGGWRESLLKDVLRGEMVGRAVGNMRRGVVEDLMRSLVGNYV